MDQTSRAAAAWDAEYRTGRYEHEPPVGFLADILSAARASRLGQAEGLYLGCGNGHNYLPLVAAGLDLVGLDISLVAIDQLARRAPNRQQRLAHGSLEALPAGRTYPIVTLDHQLDHGPGHDPVRLAAPSERRWNLAPPWRAATARNWPRRCSRQPDQGSMFERIPSPLTLASHLPNAGPYSCCRSDLGPVVENTLAPLSAIANFLFTPLSRLWSLLVIALDPTSASRTTSLTNWTVP